MARWAGRLVPLAVLLFWILVLRPVALGGATSYVIVTGGSMEPTLRAGDLVLGQRQATYAVGDVVVYRLPAHLGYGDRQVVHRITGGDAAAGFTLQGDAAEHADPWRVPADHVLGKVDTVLPLGGRIALFLRNPWFLASLAAGLAFALVVARGSGVREPREPNSDPATASPSVA